jgi:hypothetical protein
MAHSYALLGHSDPQHRARALPVSRSVPFELELKIALYSLRYLKLLPSKSKSAQIFLMLQQVSRVATRKPRIGRRAPERL